METCNVGTGQCVAGTPPVCDDGLYCNGTGTCNEGTDSCDPGTPPNCNDGVSCTVDSCNEGSDTCDHVANNALCPDDGAFCTGTEFCDAILDCQSTGNPCSVGQTCNETTDNCEGDGVHPKIWMSFKTNTGNFAVPGVSGANEDVPEFTGTFGSATSCTFSMRLDLSTRGIATSADAGSLHIVE